MIRLTPLTVFLIVSFVCLLPFASVGQEAVPVTTPGTPAAGTGEVAAVAEPDAAGVLRLVENRPIGRTSKAKMLMRLESARAATRERRLEMYRSKKDNDNQNLFIHFLSPADMLNTTYLVLEENRDKKKWIYLSSFKKRRKIVSKDNSSSFVSSDFTYEDMEIIHADEYECSGLTEEELDGRPVWRIDAVKKDPTTTAYSRCELSVCRVTHIPLRIRLFDQKGQHAKTLTAGEIEEIQGIPTPKVTVMEDHRNASKTTLRVESIEYDLTLPADTFTTRNMEK